MIASSGQLLGRVGARRVRSHVEALLVGCADDSDGGLLREADCSGPGADPTHDIFRTENSGPTEIDVYDDDQFDQMLEQMEGVSRDVPTRIHHLVGPLGSGCRQREVAFRGRQLLHQRRVPPGSGRAQPSGEQPRVAPNDKAGSPSTSCVG